MNIVKSSRAAGNVTMIVFEVVFVLALIPVIVTSIMNAENLTSTEKTLLSLIPTLLVIGLLYLVGKQTGMIKGK